MSSYIDSQPRLTGYGVIYDEGQCWADYTRTRLEWLYGKRAAAIVGGQDPATQADIARWNALGRKDAA